jgi:transcriptional regulator with XRE-family HTH domain
MATERRSRKGEKSAEAGPELASRLREERTAQGLSVRELARRLELSPSAISQIETGRARPSVSTLYSIVTELGMSLDELFRPVDAPAAPGGSSAKNAQSAPKEEDGRVVQRSDSRKTLDLESGVRWERLTPAPEPEVDFLYVVYDVGGASSAGALTRHSGREHGLILTGRLEVTVGFETYELGPGDSVSFDSTEPHRLRNIGDVPVEGIWVVLGRRGDDRRAASLRSDGDAGGG